MKTLTFTDEEIELLCRGVLALQDQEADLGPLIALHAKLTQKTVRYLQFDDSIRMYVERGLHPTAAALAQEIDAEIKALLAKEEANG